jgi:enoyl-CoA hydratase
MSDVLLSEKRDRVLLLTLNRPDARNALNPELALAISEALDSFENDSSVDVAVITGSGDKAFCAGLDLKALLAGQVDTVMNVPGGFAGIGRRRSKKPIIAAVNGAALAGGLEVMLSCDLVVAVEHAVFGIPEVKRGLIAGAGGLIRLPRRMPYQIALELALTGDPIDAQRAATLGLINKVVPAEKLIEEALALAARISENSPMALAASKDVMARSLDVSEDEAWIINDAAVAVIFTSADAIEGASAFAEKRAPRWSGR